MEEAVAASRGALYPGHMASVRVELPHHSYEILIEAQSLDRLGEVLRERAPHASCGLFVDGAIVANVGARARASLERFGYTVAATALEPGEQHKTLETVQRIYERLLDAHLERRSPVIALGGGVVGDTVGFAAATYLRGVPFVQCPTTLLAMVDSSVGGKVGVNLPRGKNLIGAFHQPIAVVVDPLVLASLPDRELRCGLAECVKHGAIRDPELLNFIARSKDRILAREPEALTELIARNVAIKAAVVMADEKESGVRAHLNFGHTFAHAIEATAGYGEFLHGEAVSLGMVAAGVLSERLGLCSAEVPQRLCDLLGELGLPTRAVLPPDEHLLAAMRLDKKVAGSRVRFILLEQLGCVAIRDDVSEEQVRASWSAVRA